MNSSKYSSIAIVLLALTSCTESKGPAPVLNLGLSPDSKTGSILASEGDTLWSISKRYRVPLRAIIDVNNISAPYQLASGQRLKMPAPVDYKVREGDTLYSIANMLDVSVYDLVRINQIGNPYVISKGQYLRIPSKYADFDNVQVVDEQQDKEKINYKKPYTKDSNGVKGNNLLAKSNVKSSGEAKSNNQVVTAQKVESKRPENIVVKQGSGKFSWPVRGKVISSYGAKKGGLYNDGINIAVPSKEPILAASDGVVAYVGDDLKSYGNLILIKHAGGYTTAYAHLSDIKVKKGDKVSHGKVIGAAGSTGNVSSSQLHFEIRKGSKTYDPMKYL